MMWGIRNLLSSIGAKRIITSTRKKIHVGSVMGSFKLLNNQGIGTKMIILLQNNEKYFTYCTKIKQFVIHLHPFF